MSRAGVNDVNAFNFTFIISTTFNFKPRYKHLIHMRLREKMTVPVTGTLHRKDGTSLKIRLFNYSFINGRSCEI